MTEDFDEFLWKLEKDSYQRKDSYNWGESVQLHPPALQASEQGWLFPCSRWGGEQEQGVRTAHARGSHKSGPFCPLCPPNQQGLDDPNSWGLIHQVAP